jgi:type I restriction enzyme R subunit
MRHLIDTYIEADEPRKISPFDNMSLLELIVKTGIANAIANLLGGMKGNRNAIAEAIENNVRSKILKEHLNDPAFYEKMSAQLQEIIDCKAKASIRYLKRIAVRRRWKWGIRIIFRMRKEKPAIRALYNNLKQGGEKGTAVTGCTRHR